MTIDISVQLQDLALQIHSFFFSFRMRALPPKYQSLPCQGIRCKLSGLNWPSDAISWTKKSLLAMMNVLANVPIDAKILVSLGSVLGKLVGIRGSPMVPLVG